MLNLFKKKENNQAVNSNKTYNPHISAVIEFILAAEKRGNIVIGKRNEQIFLSFKDEELKKFLADWFPILKMHITGEIQDKYYDVFVNTVLKECNATPPNKQETPPTIEEFNSDEELILVGKDN